LSIGVLVGHGLNGRDYIARDKRQARRQRDLNKREHRLQGQMLDLRQRHDEHHQRDESLDPSADDSASRGGFG
jgi:hypothetical protein